MVTPAKTAHVLNDAILAAAKDLATRDKARRKIIFIISDGREYRSDASYGDVLKVLLSNGILVYGIGVESSAIPGYNKLEKLHIPKFGYSDILPKYANASGGEVLNEYSKNSIEDVYQQVIGSARNQYTLGYVARSTPTAPTAKSKSASTGPAAGPICVPASTSTPGQDIIRCRQEGRKSSNQTSPDWKVLAPKFAKNRHKMQIVPRGTYRHHVDGVAILS